MSDLISRKGVFIPDITVEMFRNASLESIEDLMASGEMEDILLPSAQPEQRWIPFKIDCKLPDDGQRILVNVSVRGHESVQYDEFYTDDGSYLDSGYEIGTQATAWMPLPEPYKERREDEY